MRGTRVEEKWQQMDNQSHRMDFPLDIKDLEANQEKDGATT